MFCVCWFRFSQHTEVYTVYTVSNAIIMHARSFATLSQAKVYNCIVSKWSAKVLEV